MTPYGPREAIAPDVISASRATDLPAFHMDWFMERLRAGHCAWINPFRPSQVQWISFARCRVVVFWSKDPRPLMPHLAGLRDRGLDVRLQYTLNDYEADGLEPRVPPLAIRLDTLAWFSEQLGPEQVTWRWDPFLVGPRLSVDTLLARVDRLGHQLSSQVSTLVFSFLDAYRHANRRLRAHDPGLRTPDAAERQALVAGLARLKRNWPSPVRLAACAEPEDWSCFGVERSRCVPPGSSGPDAQRRDRGQRKACGCAPSKDIGAYGTCGHLCLYCYANHNERRVLETLQHGRPDSPTLLPQVPASAALHFGDER